MSVQKEKEKKSSILAITARLIPQLKLNGLRERVSRCPNPLPILTTVLTELVDELQESSGSANLIARFESDIDQLASLKSGYQYLAKQALLRLLQFNKEFSETSFFQELDISCSYGFYYFAPNQLPALNLLLEKLQIDMQVTDFVYNNQPHEESDTIVSEIVEVPRLPGVSARIEVVNKKYFIPPKQYSLELLFSDEALKAILFD